MPEPNRLYYDDNLEVLDKHWGNGAGVVAMVAILPVIHPERWFVVRAKHAPRGR